MASSEGSGCRVFSELLSVRENALLFSLLGPQCQAEACAVAQVFLASGSGSGEQVWSCRGSGVVCLVKDDFQCSCFLRLYCVKRSKLLWEQELYTQLKYTTPRPFFHTFPADDCQAGLNFADETEAERFNAALKKQIQRAQDRGNEQAQMTHANRLDDSAGCDPRQEQGRPESSAPVQSEHEESLDPGDGFIPADLHPATRRLIREAGFSEKELGNRQTLEFVRHNINRLEGLETVHKVMKNKGPGSQILPRSVGEPRALGLKKGPLPPVPSLKPTTITPQHVSKSLNIETVPPWIPQPPSAAPPPPPERIKKSYSCKPVSSSTSNQSDLILTSLREALQKNNRLQHHTGNTSCQSEQESDNGMWL